MLEHPALKKRIHIKNKQRRTCAKVAEAAMSRRVLQNKFLSPLARDQN